MVSKKGGKRIKAASLAGSPKKEAKESFLTKQKYAFIRSFTSQDRYFLFQMIVDAVFYAVAFFGTKAYTDFFQRRMENIDPLTKAMMEQSGGIVPPQAATVMQKLAMEYILYSAALIIFLILLFAAAKLLIYNLAMKKRWSLKNYFRFLVLNLYWTASCLALLFIVQIFVSESYFPFFHLPTMSMAKINLQTAVSYVMIFLVLHVGYLSYISYIKNSQESKRLLRKSMGSALSLAFRKMYSFFVPYLVALLLWIALGAFSWLFGKLGTGQIYIVLMLIVLLLYLTWVRNYLIAFVQSLE